MHFQFSLRVWMQVALVGCVASLVSCTTAAPEETSQGTLEGGLLGYGGENYEFWSDWTPRPPEDLSPTAPLDEATVFDAWRIPESEYRRDAWDAVFHALNGLNTAIEDEATSRGIESVMLRLDPAVGEANWEIAFLSHPSGDAEGLVLRIAADAGVGLWLEAMREAGGDPEPDVWRLVVDPAAEQAPISRAVWQRQQPGWTARVASGGEQKDDAEFLARSEFPTLWTASVWTPVTQRHHVEPSFEPEPADEPLADGWPAALGEEIADRGLEDFVTDTVFIP